MRGVGRVWLERGNPSANAKRLDGHFAVDEGDNRIAIVRIGRDAHKDQVAVMDAGQIHGISDGPDNEVAVGRMSEPCIHPNVAFEILLGVKRRSTRRRTEDGYAYGRHACVSVGAVPS